MGLFLFSRKLDKLREASIRGGRPDSFERLLLSLDADSGLNKMSFYSLKTLKLVELHPIGVARLTLCS